MMAGERKKRTQGKPPVRYQEAQKVAAVAALHEVGKDHPLSNAAVAAAQRLLGVKVPLGTLARWLPIYTPQIEAARPGIVSRPPDVGSIIVKTHDEIVQSFSEVRDKALAKAQEDEKLNAAGFKDLMLGAGIAQTHIAALTGLSPEIVQLNRSLEAACIQLGKDPATMLADLIAVLKQKANERPIDISGHELPAIQPNNEG